MVSAVVIAETVREALADGRPVVALESTIFTHGLPRPRNKLAAEYDLMRRNVLRAIDRSLSVERAVTAKGGAVSPWV